MTAARLGGYDVVILDTAGRTHIDEPLMVEMAEIKRTASPHEILLVADALTGQDAVNVAKSFDERVGITGIVLTRVDGDGRGGAALSMRAVTGKPIKLIGVGEKLDALEDFDPSRIAGRILGMGDIVGLVEKAAQTIDAEKAAKAAERMRKGVFDLNDLAEQLGQMQKIGGMSGVMGMLPGIGKMKKQIDAMGLDDSVFKRQAAIISSMTGAGAAQPRPPEGEPQEARRRRLRHQGRGGQQAPQDASPDGRHDEADGPRQGHVRPHGRHDGHARRWRDAGDGPGGARTSRQERRRRNAGWLAGIGRSGIARSRRPRRAKTAGSRWGPSRPAEEEVRGT